jgi:hypothetical protein
MSKSNILRAGLAGACALALGACASSTPLSQRVTIHDLSHTIPMFHPRGKDLLKADLRRPFKGSKPIASFGFEGVRKLKPNFKTGTGHFQWGYWVFDEHYSTHLDSTDHYQNNKASLYIKNRTTARSTNTRRGNWSGRLSIWTSPAA